MSSFWVCCVCDSAQINILDICNICTHDICAQCQFQFFKSTHAATGSGWITGRDEVSDENNCTSNESYLLVFQSIGRTEGKRSKALGLQYTKPRWTSRAFGEKVLKLKEKFKGRLQLTTRRDPWRVRSLKADNVKCQALYEGRYDFN